MSTLQELRSNMENLEDKIKRLENELRKPMSSDIEDHAVEESDRSLTMTLCEIEKKNLARVRSEIMNYH